MGRISNTITLKKHKNLNLASLTRKDFVYKYKFICLLERILTKKNVLVLNRTVNSSGNNLFFSIGIFFRTQKILYFRGRLKSEIIASKKKRWSEEFFLSQLSKHFFFKENLLSIKVVNFNKKINNQLIKFFFVAFKKFLNSLFSRRFNLFIDFLKITSLVVEHPEVSSKFLYILGQTFRVLSKKNHNRFLLFLKIVFFEIINSSKIYKRDSSIQGIKFIASGKLQGKTRSSQYKITIGSVPTNTVSSVICFNKTHVFTLYGTFGFKLWIHRK